MFINAVLPGSRTWTALFDFLRKVAVSLPAIIESLVKEYPETAYWDCATILQPSLVLGVTYGSFCCTVCSHWCFTKQSSGLPGNTKTFSVHLLFARQVRWIEAEMFEQAAKVLKIIHNEVEDLAVVPLVFFIVNAFSNRNPYRHEFSFLWTINVIASSKVSDKLYMCCSETVLYNLP